ncbi:MAG: cyclic nucleotide-binding domain-containing protein [Burkholderiales bacterium]|nr:cyclic nucleotide-binding domain-containing protein [Burkholderiales bacterium]
MLGFFRHKTEHPRITRIRQLQLFATLRPRELRVIDGLLHEREYLEGEVIFDEGEIGQALYAVLAGRVLICRQAEEEVIPLAEIPTGALFGELALLDGVPRTAQARAMERCVLAALSRADFNGLLETHAGIASKIALQLARDLGQKLVARNVALSSRAQ